MRRFAFIFSLLSAVLLAACGGGSHVPPAGTGIAANLTLAPTTLSLNSGDVGIISVSLTDKFNAVVTSPPPVTYSSSNTAIANVSSIGQVCAGTWDANYIVCTPGTVGNAVITATVNVAATKNTSAATLLATMPVYVHPRVDRVVVSPSVVNCISMGTQQQLVAQAFSNGADVTSLAGPAVWTVGNGSVASVDSSSVASATEPGQTNISATVAGVNSLPITFTTCPVAKISVHITGSTATSATLTTGAKAEFTADVFDSKGTKITPNLTWLNSQPVSVTVSATTITANAKTAEATGLGPPGVAEITAACVPNSNCNVGLGPNYGNLDLVTNSGTENPSLIVAGTGTTTLQPIDTVANTLGTPVTLAYMPTSLSVNALGQTGLIGTTSGLLQYQVSGNSASLTASAAGTVLAAASDNSSAFVFDSSRNTLDLVTVTSGGNSSFNSYLLAGPPATGAAFSPDSGRAYAVAGANLYPFVFFNGWISNPAVALAGTANAVAFLPPGQFIYLAGGAASAVTVYSTYDNSLADTIAVPTTPLVIAALPNGSQVLAADTTGLDVITPTSTMAGTPPTVTDTLARVPFGATVAPRKIIVTPDSAHAVIVTDQNQLIVYTAATGTLSTIPIANGATCFSGGTNTDGSRLWLGCSDNAVHRFDFSTMTDAAQIAVPFTPDLVAVAPK